MTRWLDRLPWMLAICFGAGVVAHIIAVVRPTSDDTSSVGRHAIFILINALFAVVFLLRWRWAIVPVLPLIVQQAYSHGTDLVHAMRQGDRDISSVLVLVFLPVVLFAAARLTSRGTRASA